MSFVTPYTRFVNLDKLCRAKLYSFQYVICASPDQPRGNTISPLDQYEQILVFYELHGTYQMTEYSFGSLLFPINDVSWHMPRSCS
jgi:hypothetical protein